MSKRERLLQTVLGALSTSVALFGSEPGQAAAPKKGTKPAECFGVNSCKGTNGCAVSKDQIDAANKVFKNSFTKSKPIDCAGNSDCGGKSGFLAWASKATNEECWNAGGFTFERDAAGKLVIRDKGGVKAPS
jgi:hypothetical protein